MDDNYVIVGAVLLAIGIVTVVVYTVLHENNTPGDVKFKDDTDYLDPDEPHTPVWVSGPGGGNEEVFCDICGRLMEEHP